MVDILIRDVSDTLKDFLEDRAVRRGCSVEAEARYILDRMAEGPNAALLRLHEATRFDDGSGVDFEAPERTEIAKGVDFDDDSDLGLMLYRLTRDMGGVDEDEFQIPDRSGNPARAADFS